MDQYIRDLDCKQVETKQDNSVSEYKNDVDSKYFKQFKLCHQNIRSLPKNIDQFKVFLKQFPFDFDCLILTETWRIYDIDLAHLTGYNVFYN